jgi:signal transduction histidine kinase
VVNLVDFGTADADDGTTRPPTIVIPSRDEQTTESRTLFGSPPRSDERRRRDEAAMRAATEATTESERATAERRDRNAGDRNDGDDERRRGNRLRAFGRPPWLTQTQFEELQRKQGLHGFVLVLSSDAVRAETGRDLWLRVIIGAIALAAAIGAALAWRSMENSTRLQMRLLRAHEMNTHLQELNLAAAGLAHETRNPLNIVRGLAQMIARREDTPEEVRERSGQITEEVDRVTGRLNEFINYSRPPEPRPSATRLKTVVADVERALGSDFSDKGLQFEWVGPDLTVEADESLLRQVLFNMLLNAVQAVPDGGLVRVSVANGNHGEASLAVEDNGPGVPDEFREEIFRPYFTTNSHGTGLGLAVVNQIVLAHRWEIGYVRNEMGGASFRVSGLKTV